jgi:hypothetical protein
MIVIVALAVIILIASVVAMMCLRQEQRVSPSGLRAAMPATVYDDVTRVVARVESQNSDAVIWSPSAQADAHVATVSVETALLLQQPDAALTAAESAVAATPSDPRALLLLAWAAIVGGHASAAGAAMYKLRQSSEPYCVALADYVEARARHLIFEYRAGASGALPPLITAGDLAVVALARSRGGPLWVVGEVDMSLDSADGRAAVDEHRTETLACLTMALRACLGAPHFVDAGYLAARLMIKSGLVSEGKRMMVALAPHMEGRPDAVAFARDRAALSDPSLAYAAATTPPPPAPAEPPPLSRGQRSKSLRVLP